MEAKKLNAKIVGTRFAEIQRQQGPERTQDAKATQIIQTAGIVAAQSKRTQQRLGAQCLEDTEPSVSRVEVNVRASGAIGPITKWAPAILDPKEIEAAKADFFHSIIRKQGASLSCL